MPGSRVGARPQPLWRVVLVSLRYYILLSIVEYAVLHLTAEFAWRRHARAPHLGPSAFAFYGAAPRVTMQPASTPAGWLHLHHNTRYGCGESSMVIWCSIGLFGPTDDALWPQMASDSTLRRSIGPCNTFRPLEFRLVWVSLRLERRRKAEFLIACCPEQQLLRWKLYK
jgi:hypothetical protein